MCRDPQFCCAAKRLLDWQWCPRHAKFPPDEDGHKLTETPPMADSSTKDLEERIAKLQRAVYHLVWKRTGFGEQCVHCGQAYPNHGEKCKAAEAEALVR